MGFSDPIFLWALLGLAIPVAIHLWSKKKLRIVKIGSTKLLEDLRPKRSNRIRLSEWPLLLIRMLAVGLAALLLSSPKFKREEVNQRITYIIDPLLVSHAQVRALMDTLSTGTARWLSPGLPSIKTIRSMEAMASTPNYWQLAREMDSLASDSIVVLTKGLVAGIKGRRPTLGANTEWIVMGPDVPVQGAIGAIRKKDSIELLMAIGSGEQLTFGNERVPLDSDRIRPDLLGDSIRIIGNRPREKLALKHDTPLKVLIVYNDSVNNEVRYLRSGYSAIAKYLDREISVVQIKEVEDGTVDGYDMVIWLHGKPAVQTLSPILIYRPDSLAQTIIGQDGKKNVYYLTKKLDAENIMEEGLTGRLLKMLDLHKELSASIGPYDIRSMDGKGIRPVRIIREVDQGMYRMVDLAPWIWAILAVVLIGERILARHRKQ